ncbi:MAG: hypothetical protein QOC67_5871, partial [Pseudonocardiales bacterium]|nr:hypothetical protein [Pseudonocardiales bacterium]
MSTTLSDADRVARLAAELAELGRRLAWARFELLSMAPPPAAPPPPHAVPPPVPPHQPTSPPPAQPTPPAQPSPEPPNSRESQLNGQLLPWAGGAITLIGVVMFLALAASRGWFGVPARLVAGGILGLVLVGLAHRVHRRVEGQAGALALAGTGI